MMKSGVKIKEDSIISKKTNDIETNQEEGTHLLFIEKKLVGRSFWKVYLVFKYKILNGGFTLSINSLNLSKNLKSWIYNKKNKYINSLYTLLEDWIVSFLIVPDTNELWIAIKRKTLWIEPLFQNRLKFKFSYK